MTVVAAHKGPLGPGDVGLRKDGTAEVTCWCEARSCWVPLPEIRAGLTHSCGREHCQPVWCLEHNTYALACCGGKP